MKTAKMVVIIVLALGPASVSLAVEEVWTEKADMPTARYGLTCSVVDAKIYAVGGAAWTQKDFRTIEEYDPLTDSWTKKADMPNTRCWHSASVVNGRIYVIGGFAGGALSGMVEEYDPATDTWTRKADMPTARWWLSTSVVNGKIYAIGGAGDAFGKWFDTVEEYDPATDTWTRKANMPIRRFALSTSGVNGRIYIIGGASAWGIFVRAVEEYDPATDTWTKKADIPTPRGWLSTSVMNGEVYAIGGCVDVHGVTFSTVEAYNPKTDSWIEWTDMPTPRKALATSVVNGKIYAIGGSAVPDWNTCISTVEEYDLIPPTPPDFNGDGMIDIKDLLLLIESWGQDDPLVDIAPLPFGDGVVDALDLELLMSYWGQPVDDPTLIAHWALDEVEGDIASDSANYNDGTVYGDPAWQPKGGMIDGALQLDGIDDYVSTPFVLNPTDGAFSAVTWIKGGAPGQVIISQTRGFGGTWLGTNSSEGKLMTGLSDVVYGVLESESVITDGQWHHVGLVSDSALHRHLYVDGVEVAVDSGNVVRLPSNGGLYIGAAKDLDATSFFSGLIDDVRIYNRVVRP